jgi:hypothetical protein
MDKPAEKIPASDNRGFVGDQHQIEQGLCWQALIFSVIITFKRNKSYVACNASRWRFSKPLCSNNSLATILNDFSLL